MKKNIKFLSEDDLFEVMIKNKLSIDMISEGIYDDISKQLNYNNVSKNEQLLLARVRIYYDKAIELLKFKEFLHSFTVILGIYELRLMELPNIREDYRHSISLKFLDSYTSKIRDKNLSIKEKQILIELILNEYKEYESEDFFNFEHFRSILESVIDSKDITAYFIKNIENKSLYKLEKNDYIVALKEELGRDGLL